VHNRGSEPVSKSASNWADICEGLLRLFGKKQTTMTGQVGLAVNGKDWSFIWADPSKEVGQLRHWETLTEGDEMNALTLRQRVAALSLQDLPCHCVLDIKDYNLQLVEAPAVPDSELKMAIQFQLKNDVVVPLDEIELQLLEVPEGAYSNQGKMYYAAAVERRKIVEVRDRILAAGLHLESIGIRELAFKNLALMLNDDSAGLASLEIRAGVAKLNLLKAGKLFLTRNLTTAVDHAAMASPDWKSTLDRLVVELQRSLDYFENQMGQGQILNLVLAPVPGLTNQLVEELNRSMMISAEALDVNKVWGSGTLLSAQDQHDLLFAAGAALSGWPTS